MPGRCAGCGRTGPESKINLHVIDCPDYLDLYARQPDKALTPVAEYTRYRTEDRNPEARAEQRSARLVVRFAEINRQQAVSAARWAKPPDLLD